MQYINKIERGKLLKRDQLLPSKQGQILSTQLSDNDLISLELYSLAKDEEISSHNLMEKTLYVVLSGTLAISGNKIQEKGYLFVKGGTPSKLVAIENTQILVYTFKTDVDLRNLTYDKTETLNSQIDLVKNAVSSKVIIQKKGLSLTLFSLDVGEGLNTHKAGGDAMVIPLEGAVDIKIADTPYSVKEGDFIILPVGIPHSLIATKPYKMLLTVINQ